MLHLKLEIKDPTFGLPIILFLNNLFSLFTFSLSPPLSLFLSSSLLFYRPNYQIA